MIGNSRRARGAAAPFLEGLNTNVNRPTSQHWVPRFYLRHFSTPQTRNTDEPQVWIFSKDRADGDEVLASVRKVCARRYLYSPVSESGERTWDLEEKLADLEAELGALWPALAEDYRDISDPDLRKALSLFVAVMHLRSPETLRAAEEIHQGLVAFFESAPQRPDGTPDVDSVEISGIVRLFDAGDWHAYKAWGKNDHQRFFARLIQAEAVRTARVLLKKRWSMIVSERDTFVASDKPVGTHHGTHEVFGLKTAGVIVTFPVSPRRLLIMDDRHEEPANQYYPLNISTAGAFNGLVWRNGSRFMITGRAIPEVLTEIVECEDFSTVTPPSVTGRTPSNRLDRRRRGDLLDRLNQPLLGQRVGLK